MQKTSGKLVIITILTVALLAAGASWWFRYAATHQAARFWGPRAAQLIRDAPVVALIRLDPPADSTSLASKFRASYAVVDPADVRDITGAGGVVHLRNALLEDRSYNWPVQRPRPDNRWAWALRFQDIVAKDEGALLLFSADCKFVTTFGHPEMLSCEPIADGLAKMFSEFIQEVPAGR